MTEKEQFKLMHVKNRFAQNNGVELIWSWTYYKWTNNGSLSLISSWPPAPDNVHLDEHIHVSWQCWLRNHESSQTKGPFTSLRIHFAEVPFHDTYLDWEPVDEEQRTRNYENVCDIRLIITEADTGGHASDLAWRWEINVLYCPFTS